MVTTVRAAYIDRLGPPEVIQVGPVPEAPLGTTDVRVEVRATTVDPVDCYVRDGRYPTATPFPFVVGRDLVGVVVATGDGVSRFAVGDEVWCDSLGYAGRQGATAERVLVPEDRLYPLPEGVDPEAAVVALHPGATAWMGLFREARLQPGETVVIGGGGGNVGTAATRMAATAGAHVVATARPADAPRCLEAGAEAVVDHHDPAWPRQLAEAAPQGIDVYWNTAGHHPLGEVLPLLSAGGRIVVTAATAPETAVPIRDLYLRDLRILGCVLSLASVADLARAAALINDQLAAGGWPVRIADRLPLEATADAHRRLEAGGVPGRFVIRPNG
jgi:NADPH:quinone reductase-like Zn-dependent oxidoreductase